MWAVYGVQGVICASVKLDADGSKETGTGASEYMGKCRYPSLRSAFTRVCEELGEMLEACKAACQNLM